jgi:hypothetical protein
MAEEEEEAEPDKLCFVVGPIGADDSADRVRADWLLEMVIEPVMVDFPQFAVKRADKISIPGMIDAQIINALLTADLVIADLSNLNPNAFYEIGIRHMAQKPIIHMQAADEKIPFDVSLFRSIKYSIVRPRDLREARTVLKSQIDAVLASGYRVDNPVTRTRGVVEFEKDATSGERVLLDQIRGIESRLSRFESGFMRPVPIDTDSIATTTITFRNRRGLTPKQIETIKKTLTAQFGIAPEVSRSSTNLVVAVPAYGESSRIIFPRSSDMKDVEIIWHDNE